MGNDCRFIVFIFATALTLQPAAHAQERQLEVAKRGALIMPFALNATTHIFTKSSDGGVQRVIAKSSIDQPQIQSIREHLREITGQFSRGDFSGPVQIHGAEMPGLAQMRAATPGRISISYRDLPAGAEIVYATADPALTRALHLWFDAQLGDHGHDATAGDGTVKHHQH